MERGGHRKRGRDRGRASERQIETYRDSERHKYSQGERG